ncbi:hypothetical protein MKW94_004514 [Papaver nudicaule]|uniref:DUF7950 domain-containing protein n=1 Tax=Papaver nudicaule TaxID=74823 RepID=A0AA41W155_PAPNU|nr:hypothetical protein [Papaver nudicaule]
MLRFRPIAPKPAVSGSVSGETTSEKSDVLLKNGGRIKRRYVKDTTKSRKNNNNSRRKKILSDRHLQHDHTAAAITLSLLPEKPDDRASPSNGYVPVATWSENSSSPSGGAASSTSSSKERTVMIPHVVRPVGSCVTVQCITETFCEESVIGFLGRTDEEKMMYLQKDTCPGFISDGLNRVRWTNESYRKLVNQDGFSYGGEQRQEMVWLVMKDNESLPLRCEGFVCRVRLQYTCKKERCSLIVPCDAWKMNGGGFVWRLDFKAALSLGR